MGRIGLKGEINAPWQVLEDFASMHKGKSVAIRMEILPVEPSEKTRGYFFGYVLSEVQNALMDVYGERMSKEQSYDWLRRQCPLFITEERVNGEWKAILKDFEDLDQAEAGEVIDWTIQFCAENFNLILDLPK